jgi:3-hydroxyisobutyrate dehydrogenase-like beta-hydroxyacid dehydrogenase
MIKTISYLGLGTMGSGMPSNLLRVGYDLTVWNRSAAGLIEKFAASLQSPTPALRVVGKNLGSAVALGFGKENASAVIKALEKEAGVEVKARAAG